MRKNWNRLFGAITAILLVVALAGCITITPPPIPVPDDETVPVVEPTDEAPVEPIEEPVVEPTPDPVEEPVEEPIEELPEEPEEPTPEPCTPCNGARINHESEQCYAVGETLPSGCIVAARSWFDCPREDGSRYIIAATRQWCDPEPAPKPETSRWACDPKCPCYGARVHDTRPGVCPQCYAVGETLPSGCAVIARGWFKCTADDGTPFLLEGNRQWVDPDPAPKPNIDPQPIELLPEIASFTAEPMVIHDGDEVILRFDIRGASSADLTYGEYAYGGVTEPIYGGQNQKTIRPTGDGCATIRARNTAGEVEAKVCVEIQCRYEWVPEIRNNPPSSECPRAPYSGWMAYQRFEHGVMIWSEGTDTIYVLFDKLAGNEVGYTRVLRDNFNEGDPESDPSFVPPSGLLQPIRGFGLVWRNNQDVRERLGWAVERERGYNGWIQSYVNGKYFSGGLIKSIDGTIYNITWLYQYWTIYVP